MRKQFDLQYYLAHPEVKVITRDGNSARIICADLKDKCHKVVAVYDIGDCECLGLYYSNGSFIANVESDKDLFFDLPDPEKKKVPLTYDDLLERIKSGKTMWLVNDRGIVFNIVDFDFGAAHYIYGAAKEVIHVSYEELMNGTTFVDCSPCWKEVEE